MVSKTLWPLLCLTYIAVCAGQNVTEANNKETLEKAVANLTQALTNFQSTFQEILDPIFDQIHSSKRATDDKDLSGAFFPLNNLTTYLGIIISELYEENSVGPDSNLSDEAIIEDLKKALMGMKTSIEAVKSNNSCATGVDGSAESNKDLKQSFSNVRQALKTAFSSFKEDVVNLKKMALKDYVSHESFHNINISLGKIMIVLRENGYKLDEPKSSPDLSTKNSPEDRMKTWKQALIEVPKAVEVVTNISNNLCAQNKTNTEDTDMENITDIVTDGPMIDNEDTTKTRPHKLEVPGIVAAFNFSEPTKTKTLTPVTFDDAVNSLDRNRHKKAELRSILSKSFRDADKNRDKEQPQLSYEEFLKYTEGTPLTDDQKENVFEEINATSDDYHADYQELVSFVEILNSAIWYAADNA